MLRFLVRVCALAAVVALIGCGRGQVRLEQTPEDRETRLGDDCAIDLAAWLAKPRGELAKLADEQDAHVDTQREGFRHQSANDLLLPKLATPRTIAVFRKAKYDSTLGVSLPDYVKRDKPDAALAIHFARFGDHDAAVKFIGNDPDVGKAVNALRTKKVYPAEWTRLVSLTLIAAQNKLAVGDAEGAKEIVGIHRQLTTLLDEKAAAGPLGAALLPAGRRAIAQAARAFRTPNWNKTALAEDLDKAVAEWGNSPSISTLGMDRAQAEKLFANKAVGRAIVSADLDRARDLLSLPLPTEAAQSVIAFLDSDGYVAEVAVAYRGKLETTYPEDDHLAYHLDEAGIAAKDGDKSHGVSKKTYAAKDQYEITRSQRGGTIGAVVRINGGKSPPAVGLRDLGVVSLDRGFEANRAGWAPSRPGPLSKVDDKDALKAIVTGTPLPAPALASMQRDKTDDVVQVLRLTWSADFNSEAGTKLLPALAAFGPASIEGVEENAGALCFRWQDSRTKAEFRLPFDDKPPVLVIEDASTGANKLERVERVRQRDEKERTERIAAGKARITLPRSAGKVNDFSLEKLALGQERSEAEAVLPSGKDFRVKSVPGGIHVLVLSNSDEQAAFWASQILIRFDAKDKVREIRVRYAEGGAKKGDTLLARLSAGKAGQPETLTAPWVGLWADQPAAKVKPAFYRWQDDQTTRTYQRDAGGSEVILRQRGAETPWRFVSRGPKGISLGNERQAIEKTFKPVQTSGGATVYQAPSTSAHKLYMVWYANNRVDRIVAVSREQSGVLPEEVAKSLKKAWANDLDDLGAIRRKDTRRGQILGSYFWHDDATRVQTFAQLTDKGAQVLTEWRAWPLPSVETAKR